MLIIENTESPKKFNSKINADFKQKVNAMNQSKRDIAEYYLICLKKFMN